MKDLDYYKNNCEADYLHTPISVLKYITELEESNKTKGIRNQPNTLTIDHNKKPKTKKCDYCNKRKDKENMYFLLKEDRKEYWICNKCNYEHDVV